jgi:3-methyl-2-oxobutanoate hydroxymethyltransferase
MEKEIKIEKKKMTLTDFNKMKLKNEKVAWITSYDMPFAQTAEEAGIDMILVGDSGGMVQLGYQTTNPVTMDEMIVLAKAARRGAPNTFIIGDMPQGAYEIGDKEAITNALRFVKEAGCDAIKLEGGIRMCSRVKAITDAGILVMGHLGLTPQSTSTFGGYRVQGKTVESYEKTLEDAFALQEAGAFAILLEAIPSEPAGQIAKQLKVPVYGIGAGQLVDGQLIILHDLLGLYKSFRPWFAKCYIPSVIKEFEKYISGIENIRKVGTEERKDGLLVLAGMAIKRYIDEVRSGAYPKEEFSYPLKETDLEILRKSKGWK